MRSPLTAVLNVDASLCTASLQLEMEGGPRRKLTTTEGYIASHRETHDNFDLRLLSQSPIVVEQARWVLD